MDLFSLLGITIGLAAIILGQYLEGGSIFALMNLPAFVIVVGGTLGAVILETPMRTFINAIRTSKKAFFKFKYTKESVINDIVQWSHASRKDGFLGLEKFSHNRNLPENSRIALKLLVDGKDATYINEYMHAKLINKQENELGAIKVFESMGGYSPTIGIIGAVLGLIQVLSNLSDPSNLGQGIAIAFVATIYGVGFANLLFIPISKRLRNILFTELNIEQLYIEGIIAISQGENPKFIEQKLRTLHEAA